MTVRNFVMIAIAAMMMVGVWGGLGKSEVSAQGQRILLINDGLHVADFVGALTAGGHTVTTATVTPASLAGYDQYWDVRYGAPYMAGTANPEPWEQTILKNFMATGGKVVIFFDHSSGGFWAPPLARKNYLEQMVNDIVPPAQVGKFSISLISAGDPEIGRVDTVEAKKVDPVNYSAFAGKTYTLGWPCFVLKANLAGAIAPMYLQSDPNKKTLICFNDASLKAPYSNGRLVLFTDLGNACTEYFAGSIPMIDFIASVATGAAGVIDIDPSTNTTLNLDCWDGKITATSSKGLKNVAFRVKSTMVTSTVTVSVPDTLRAQWTLNYGTWPASDSIRVISTFTDNKCDTQTVFYRFVKPINDYLFSYTGLRRVQFTDLSDALFSGKTFSWNFGSGQGTTTTQNPLYTFTGTGTSFSVKEAIAYSATCNDTITKTIPLLTFKLADDSTGKLRTVKAGTVMNIWSRIDSAGKAMPNNGKAYGLLSGTPTFIVNGGNANATLSAFNTANNTFTFTPTKVAPQVIIQATFTDASGAAYVARDTFQVIPGNPVKVTLESSMGVTGPSLDPVITIASTVASANGYAHIWDAFGNFIGYSSSTTWSIMAGSGTYVKNPIVKGTTANGEGIISKAGPSGVRAGRVRATDASGLFGEADVTIDAVSYSNLRIIDIANAVRSGTTITIPVDTTPIDFYAEAYRADINSWDPYSGGNWSMDVAGVGSITPTSGQTTRFTPLDTGTVKIAIASGLLPTVFVTIKVVAGKPKALELWQNNAKLDDPVSRTYVVSADSVFNLESRLFDGSNAKVRLTNAALLAQITWELVDATTMAVVTDPNLASLSTATGANSVFKGKRAGGTYLIRGKWNTLSDSVKVTVVPGSESFIRIVHNIADSSSTTLTAKAAEIILTPVDTVKLTYSLICDQYGNFIRWAGSASWNTLDASIVFAIQNTTTAHGDGLILRASDSTKSTYVTAQSGSFIDSVKVTLSAVGITGLRIVVNIGGTLTPITSLTMRSDEDTTVFIQGLRSDGKGWTSINATWTNTNNGMFNNWVGNASLQYIDLLSNGAATVTATFNAHMANLTLNIGTGLANSLALYKSTTFNPIDASSKYKDPSDTILVTAGDTALLVANIFDNLGAHLTAYRTSADSISWTIAELSPGTTGLFTNGANTVVASAAVKFVPTMAFRDVLIIGKLDGTALGDTVKIHVQSAAASQISIEQSAAISGSLFNNVTSYDPITLTPRDTTAFAYAIYRDRFGNYVGMANNDSITWFSTDKTIDSTREERTTLGEVKIFRVDTAGSTKLIVWNDLNPALCDTVTVNLESVSYDSLRIVSSGMMDDTVAFPDVLTLLTGRSDTLYVKGFNSATRKWDIISAKWNITAGLASALTNVPGGNQQSWEITPTNVGTGWIYVTKGSGYPDSVAVEFKPGEASSIRFYNLKGDPSTTAGSIERPASDNIVAGIGYTLSALAFDMNGRYLSAYEDSSTKFHWAILNDPDTTGGLSWGDIGQSNIYVALKAYRTVNVAVWFENSNLTDTIALTVGANVEKKLYIEGSKDKSASPNKPNELTSITITSQSTSYNGLYAVLRDDWGNFISASVATIWRSEDPSKVTAENGDVNFGQGLLTRKAAGKTYVWAKNSNPVFALSKDSDDVEVLVQDFYYTALRITRSQNAADTINAANISTNDDLALWVYGQRSTDFSWELVNANWALAPDTLRVTPNAPENASTWTFSPVRPGAGTIRVWLEGSIITTADTMAVTFRTGAPTVFEILLPDSIVAGDSAKGILTIRNEDGQVIGDWTGKIVILDPTSSGTVTTLDGQVIKTGVIVGNDTIPFGDSITVTFKDGRADIQLVIVQSGNHAIEVDFMDTSRTEPLIANGQFIISPDSARQIDIVSNTGDPLPSDTVYIRGLSFDYLQYMARGKDRFNNDIGFIAADWTPDSLFNIENPLVIDATLFTFSAQTIERGTGFLRATATGKAAIRDSITIIVTPPSARIIASPITRDTDGDGWLDRIDLLYNRNITVPNDSDISVINGSPSLVMIVDTAIVDSVLIDTLNGISAPRMLYIYLVEDSSTVSQTGWTPTVSVDIVAADPVYQPASDGAGPVLVKAVKKVDSGNKDAPEKQEITLSFSEDVYDPFQQALSQGQGPEMTLNAWQRSSGTFIDPTLGHFFDGVTSYTGGSAKAATFTMTGSDSLYSLESFHWLNLSRNHGQIMDMSGNLPAPDSINRRVPVQIDGSGIELKAGPNPMVPAHRANFKARSQGDLTSVGFADGCKAVKYDRYGSSKDRGTVFDVTYFVAQNAPITPATLISARLLIYDAAGNLFFSQDAEDHLMRVGMLEGVNESEASALSSGVQEGKVDIAFYWSGWGLVDGALKEAAPGMYRVTLMLKVGDDKQQVLQMQLAVAR